MGLLIYIFIWHSLDSRRDSLLPSLSADRNVFTLTPPKSTRSNSLTPARTSASLLRTTSLKRERPLSTLDSELRPGMPPSVRDVTPVPEAGRGARGPERSQTCQEHRQKGEEIHPQGCPAGRCRGHPLQVISLIFQHQGRPPGRR